MRLIATMVARDEADRYLDPVLDRLKQQVDVICFTDDNSTDNTVEIALSHGAKVAPSDGSSGSMFVKDESALRTKAWSWLSSHAEPGDWILAIDADEMFYPPSDEYVRWLMKGRYTVLGVTFYHMWNETEYRVDKLWKPVTSSRLFRFQPGGVFKQSKLACGSEPTYVQDEIKAGRFQPNARLAMKHLGYQRDEDKIAKHDRYLHLDGGSFHNLDHIRSIVDVNPTLETWTLG